MYKVQSPCWRGRPPGRPAAILGCSQLTESWGIIIIVLISSFNPLILGVVCSSAVDDWNTWRGIEFTGFRWRFRCAGKPFCVRLCRLMSWIELSWAVSDGSTWENFGKVTRFPYAVMSRDVPPWLVRIRPYRHFIPSLEPTRHFLTWWQISILLVLLMVSTARWKLPCGRLSPQLACGAVRSPLSARGVRVQSSYSLVLHASWNAFSLNSFGFAAAGYVCVK